MTQDDRDTLEVLKAELDFVEKGGYGRSVKTPWQPTSIFRDSPSCINLGDLDRTHPCSECVLIDFVPPEARTQDVSSTEIRRRVGAGEPIDGLVPAPVADHIHRHRLYIPAAVPAAL